MTQRFDKQLDVQTSERLKPIWERFNNQRRIGAEEVFASGAVVAALKRSSIILAGASVPRIMMSIPFYETVFVPICYKCDCTGNTEPMLPLLDSGTVVPILLNSYESYPQPFLKKILKLPHINQREYYLYRVSQILMRHGTGVCQKCAQRAEKDLLADPSVSDPVLQKSIEHFFYLLAPYIEPDFELIDQLGNAVRQRDSKRFAQILRLGSTISAIRTAQALHATQGIPLKGLDELPSLGGKNFDLDVTDLDELKQLAAEELNLVIPTNLNPTRYLEIVLPFQKRLAKVVDDIVSGDSQRPIADVFSTIETINDELRQTEKSKRFLAYRAISGFAAGNSLVIGAVLVGGALGLGGHLVPCGFSALAAVGGKLLKKWKPVRDNEALNQLGRSIRASLQPAVAKVLSSYLGISTKAVEVWQLQQEMIDGQSVVRKNKKKHRNEAAAVE